MPYPAVPPSKTKDMESCVMRVMSDPKMKSKYKSSKERKSHAIAICHSSIMGGKKVDILLNDLFKNDVGKEVTKMAKKSKDEIVKGEDEVKKQDPAEEVKEEVVEESPEEEVAEEKVEEVVEEEKSEEQPAEDAEEKPAEEPVEEKPAEEVVEEKVEATAKDEDGLSKILDKISKIEEMLAKQDAPVEEEKEEEKPEEVPAEAVEETPAEEAVKEEVVEEKVAADGGSDLQKVEGMISELSKKFDEKLDELSNRVKAIEDQPAPSKVFSPAVVKKADVEKKDEGRLEEINKRLQELDDLKRNDMKKYQENRSWEEAFKLLDEKSTLL